MAKNNVVYNGLFSRSLSKNCVNPNWKEIRPPLYLDDHCEAS